MGRKCQGSWGVFPVDADPGTALQTRLHGEGLADRRTCADGHVCDESDLCTDPDETD